MFGAHQVDRIGSGGLTAGCRFRRATDENVPVAHARPERGHGGSPSGDSATAGKSFAVALLYTIRPTDSLEIRTAGSDAIEAHSEIPASARSLPPLL